MNIQRYLLPVTVAAAVHVALFLAMPDGSWKPATTIIEIPLPSWPDDPEPVFVPPEEKADTTPEVRPLPSGPTLPDPEMSVTPKPIDITIPIDPKPVSPAPKTTLIPTTPGIEGIGPIGTGKLPRGIALSDQLDRTPNAKVQIPPDYPPAMSHSGTNGSATVEFDVNTEGHVVRVVVVNCTHREFGDAAARAVSKWRFEPGRRNGLKVPFRMTQQIEFGIDPN